MAYRSLEREPSFAYGSTTSCLDGVPFTIGPQFQFPNQVRLQANLLKRTSHAREEYNFEIEEGVMKWAEERERALERERQLQSQRLEEEVKKGKLKRGPITVTEEESDSEPEDEWLKQTSGGKPDPVSTVRERPKPPPRPPQPRRAVISNDILTPIQISSPNNKLNSDSGSNKPVDVTLFETEDDPFDMFERQTLNDLEELKNVFQCTNQTTNVTATQPVDVNQSILDNSVQQSSDVSQGRETVYANGPTFVNSAVNDNSPSDSGEYIKLAEGEQTKISPQVDFKKLPPVPPRRFLVGRDPLPPINNQPSAEDISVENTISTNYQNVDLATDNPFHNVDNAEASGYENKDKPYFKPVDSDLPSYENVTIQESRVVFSRTNESSSSHESLIKSASKTKQSNYVNVAPGLPFRESGMRNVKSTPDIVKTLNGVSASSDVFDKAPFPKPRSPPYRPSSQQDLSKQYLYVDLPSWNKYSPLPSPRSPSSKSSSTSDFASPSEVDPYLNLSSEGQEVVNNLVGMGFSRPRVSRAVQNFGCDEKEIVEHLFQVDKMKESGLDSYQSELALVIHKNKRDKAEVYLTLYKQFQELGFNGDRIKDALVKFDNDSDKALDYLTT